MVTLNTILRTWLSNLIKNSFIINTDKMYTNVISVLFASVFLITVTNGVTVMKNVTISKCCDLDEHTSKQANYACISGEEKFWTPRIYSLRKKKLLDPGVIPSNWHLKASQRPDCKGSNFTVVINPQRNYIVFENGSMWLVEYNKLVRPDRYCIDYNAAFICVEEVQTPQPLTRVKKCCGESAVYNDTKKSCITTKGSDYRIDVDEDKTLVAGFPSCEDQQMVIAGKLHEGKLQENGSLLLEKANVLLPAGDFCLEHVLENAGQSPSIFTCHNFLPPSKVLISPNVHSDLRFTLYPIGLALSAVFLAATLAAGSLLPASHHVLHWRCQTNHVVCLLVGYILLCITQIAGRGMSPTPCFMIAVAMHFLFLAAFFWLNTMCFNIWWTFRDLRPQSLEKSQERCRLRIYEVYAWGGPLLIAGTAAILDSIPDNSEYAFLRPRFGTSNCWFHGNLEILTYFYGPIGALLAINMALFVMTARELTCGLWKRELVKSTTERAALGRVCMKLVVVMGVTWIADIISWAVGGPQEVWYVTDLINCLQGVLIFIVVGCQPQVLTAVKRWWCWRKRHTTGTAGTTNHHSSSSQGLPSMGDTVTNNSVTNNTKSIPMETSC